MNPFTPPGFLPAYTVHVCLARLQIRNLCPETFENVRGFLILNRIRSSYSWFEVPRCLTVVRVGCSLLSLNLAVFNMMFCTPCYSHPLFTCLKGLENNAFRHSTYLTGCGFSQGTGSGTT